MGPPRSSRSGASAGHAELSAQEWEAWGVAASCAGVPEQAVSPFERAIAAYEGNGELECAARVALLLTNVKLEGRDLAIGEGWHRRALGH